MIFKPETVREKIENDMSWSGGLSCKRRALIKHKMSDWVICPDNMLYVPLYVPSIKK